MDEHSFYIEFHHGVWSNLFSMGEEFNLDDLDCVDDWTLTGFFADHY